MLLWYKDRGEKVNALFYKIDLTDEYKYGMGNVDQADQLRLQYRIHYWLRNQWAVYFWIFELSLTNSYVLYRLFFEMHDNRPPLSHYELIKPVALAWIDPKVY